MAPEQGAILTRCSFASITPVWMVIVAQRDLYFGLSVAMAARSLARCYFPRGCCVSACTSRGMKHSMGQLTFCQEGRKSVRALRWVWFVLGAVCGQPIPSTKHTAGSHSMHCCLGACNEALLGACSVCGGRAQAGVCVPRGCHALLGEQEPRAARAQPRHLCHNHTRTGQTRTAVLTVLVAWWYLCVNCV